MEKQGTALSIRTANEVVMDEKNGTGDKALAIQNGHMENGIAMPEKGQTKIVINPERQSTRQTKWSHGKWNRNARKRTN